MQSEAQSANDRQVGGSHYQSGYQHWDFMCDVTDGAYLLGCASKYVTRWKGKNGLQDLEKAQHYLQKAKERGVKGQINQETEPSLHKFLANNPLDPIEAQIIIDIMCANYDEAVGMIDHLKTQIPNEAKAAG